MKTYKVIQESSISNPIVKELNAAVLMPTFPNCEEPVTADLYECFNSTNVLVAKGHCGPIHGNFVRRVKLDFSRLTDEA